jgi:hypothetical protein
VDVAGPGDVVAVQGARFGTAPAISIGVVTSDGAMSAMTCATVLQKADTYFSFIVPQSFPVGLYAFWIKAGIEIAGPFYINKAEIWWAEFPEIQPSNVFRVFGKNLKLSSGTPTITFTNGAIVLSGTVGAGDTYGISITAPAALVAGQSYTLKYSNGNGGALGVYTHAPTLPVIAQAADDFGLGVPWSASFHAIATNVLNVKNAPYNAFGDDAVGHCDEGAIQAAIDAASTAGGGTVYLPTGTYRLCTFPNLVTTSADTALFLKNNVVLKGDGSTLTILHGAPTTPPTYPTATPEYAVVRVFDSSGGHDMGVLGVGINFTSAYQNSGFIGPSVDAITRVFTVDVAVNHGTSGNAGIHMGRGSRYLVRDCRIVGTKLSKNGGRWGVSGFFVGASYVWLKHNTFYVTRGHTGPKSYSVTEDNHIIYDGDYQLAREPLEDPISTQTVLSADSTHLTVSGTPWTAGAYGPPNSAKEVWIITGGAAVGQGKRISTNTTNTLTVDSAWTTIPSPGDTFNVINIPSEQNRFFDVVGGMNNFVMQNNVHEVTGAIPFDHNDGEFFGVQGDASPSGVVAGQGTRQYGVVTAATNNTVTNTGTLTDAGNVGGTGSPPPAKNWTTNIYGPPWSYQVYVASGPGAGQVRTITANTANQVTVSPAWDLTPAAGNEYTIFPAAATHGIIKGNTYRRHWNCLMLYTGGDNIIIANNTFEDANGIFLQADFRPSQANNGRLLPVLDILVLGNTVRRTLTSVNKGGLATPFGLAYNTAGYIETHLINVNAVPSPPLAVVNVLMRGNTIVAFFPAQTSWKHFPALQDGYQAFVATNGNGGGGPYSTGMVNVILDKNTGDTLGQGLSLSQGVVGVVLYVPTWTNVTTPLGSAGPFPGTADVRTFPQ